MENTNCFNFGGQDSMLEDTAGRNMTANPYDGNSPYKKGAICIQNNKLYEANQNIDVAEQFTESHWTETTLGDIVSKNKSDIGELTEKLMLQNSASLGYPDYENVTLLAENKKASGIIAESGYLFVNESGPSSEMAIKINSKVTVNVRLANSKFIPVFAGDSWEITSFTANAYLSFIPLRRLQN